MTNANKREVLTLNSLNPHCFEDLNTTFQTDRDFVKRTAVTNTQTEWHSAVSAKDMKHNFEIKGE